MTVSAAQILTTESIPKYLEERLDDLKDAIDSIEGIQVKTIAGGNGECLQQHYIKDI